MTRTPSSTRFIAGSTLAFAVALLASPAEADDRFWQNGLDGLFGDAGRWDDGMSGVPGIDDNAVFDVGGVYTVGFDGARSTDRVLVRSGLVTFDLGFVSYDLLNPLPTTPGVSVGVGLSDVAGLTITGGTLASVFADLGELPGALGMLAVSGPGGRLEIEQFLRVGNTGGGFLDITGGAFVSSGHGSIAHAGSTFGSVELADPGSIWICDDSLTIAKAGLGELSISKGAAVECADAIIASVDGSIGAVTVRGPATRWTIDGTLDVGLNGIGSLLITDGAAVTTAGFATIGTFPGGFGDPPDADAVGDVFVEGRGSSLSIEGGFFAGDLYVGFLSRGTLTVSGGATVNIAGILSINDLSLPSTDTALTFELEAADDYPTAAITAVEALEVPGSPAHGKVVLAGGYEPAPGDSFALLNVNDGAQFLILELPPLSGSLVWNVRHTSATIDIDVIPEDCALPGPGRDCNNNGIDDQCDIDFGGETDCNDNGVLDSCDIDAGTSLDCNGNGLPDSCDVDLGTSADCNGNGVPDECDATPREQKLTPDAAADGAEFAASIDVDGDRAIIGAPFDDGTGSARIYTRVGGIWTETAVLPSPASPNVSFFGESVAIDGDRVIVGASRFRDAAGDTTGTAYIYRFDGVEWLEEIQLFASDAADGARFGHDVAIDGSVAIIGATWDDEVAFAAGAAYVYRYDGATWGEEDKLTIFNGAFADNFGDAVVIAGHTAVVGAPGHQDGEVYVFEFDGVDWPQRQTLAPPDASLYATRGSIGIDGDRLVVGGREPGGDETAYVFRDDGSEWVADAALSPVDKDTNRGFAMAVGIDDATIIAGAPLDDAAGADAGTSFVFRRLGGAWSQQGRLDVATSIAGDRLGGAVAIHEDRVLAGAIGDGEQGVSAGAAYAFDLVITDCNGNGVPDDCDIASGVSEDVDGNGVPDECTCDGDIDGSGAVDFTDLLQLLFSWGLCPDCPEDLDDDGEVGFSDLLILLFNWGECR